MGKGWAGREVTEARAYWRPIVEDGGVVCWRCRRPILPGTRWTVGHVIDRAQGGPKTRGNELPEHPRCNFSAGGKAGAAKTNARRPAVRQRVERERERGIRGW